MNAQPATLAMVTLDAADVAPVADFWSKALGWPILAATEEYAMLQGPTHALGISRTPDYQPPRWPDDGHKQFHFDLSADNIEATADHLVELGATRPADQPGDTWVVLLDPAGHPFCLTDAKAWG
ncbi:VOC family protein [uncultured Agrococcus sp.]|uniref:VOC family protein n=1 Tax=uncultured Agrococcus sp. TaxID=382258 RepID=UPI0025DC6F5F|nr:VOC family protein [uncultured Agrococcus sp.]